MKVELISGTPDPEELVCRCARNDYRSEGVIGYSFEEVMGGASGDPQILRDVAKETSEHYGVVMDDDIPDDVDDYITHTTTENGEKVEHRYWVQNPYVMMEAKKRSLLAHLMGSGHWGPFEHPQATVAIEGVTRVVTHQIVRHRHFTYDQQSLRYVQVEPGPDTFYTPPMKGEDFDVDREGVHEIKDIVDVERTYDEAYAGSAAFYQELLDLGVPKEKARMTLPMGIKTNIVMSGSARAWMHVLNVRTKANVQGQTRECAEAIFNELKGWMPYSFRKYDEDVLPLVLNP